MKQEPLTLTCKCKKACSHWLAIDMHQKGVRIGRPGAVILDYNDAKVLRDWLDGYLKEVQP